MKTYLQIQSNPNQGFLCRYQQAHSKTKGREELEDSKQA